MTAAHQIAGAEPSGCPPSRLGEVSRGDGAARRAHGPVAEAASEPRPTPEPPIDGMTAEATERYNRYIGSVISPGAGPDAQSATASEEIAAALATAASPAAPGGFGPLVQVQGLVPEEEENRGLLEELTDPTAELRLAHYKVAIQTLRQLDPNNQQLVSLARPDWVPSNQTIATINTEIAKAASQRIINFVKPAGNTIGRPGDSTRVRMLPGGQQAATNVYNYLSAGGIPYSGSYPGTMVVPPGGVGYVGLRTNADGLPTVDVNLPDSLGPVRFHYE